MIIMFQYSYILDVQILSTNKLKIPFLIWHIRNIRIISINSIHIHIDIEETKYDTNTEQDKDFERVC